MGHLNGVPLSMTELADSAHERCLTAGKFVNDLLVLQQVGPI